MSYKLLFDLLRLPWFLIRGWNLCLLLLLHYSFQLRKRSKNRIIP